MFSLFVCRFDGLFVCLVIVIVISFVCWCVQLCVCCLLFTDLLIFVLLLCRFVWFLLYFVVPLLGCWCVHC